MKAREHKPGSEKARELTDLKFEITFFRGIVRRDPNCIEALQILGDAYTRSGQFKRGLQVDRKLARLCPDNPLVFYNLACSLALLNDVDEAFIMLDKAVDLGYGDLAWLQKDSDLANLREDPRFDRACRRLRAKKKRSA